MNTKFSLLAIKPLKGCHENFRKNLKENIIYQFYGGYRFLDGKEEVMGTGKEITSIEIDENKIVPKSLYYFNENSFHFELNISAIVGPNGSGKSSLLELFYASCFYQEFYLLLINPDNDAPLKLQVGEIFQKLNVEVYFIEQNSFKRLVINDGTCIIQKLDSNKWILETKSKLPFYSIAVNYSLYGLNSTLAVDKWLEALFHKNDGYKTPLVINPFRKNGNIDVNGEFHLAQSRLITNIGVNIHEKYRLNEDIYASEITFLIDPSNLYEIDDWPLTTLITTFEKDQNQSVKYFIQDLYSALINDNQFDITAFDFNKFLLEDAQFDDEPEQKSDEVIRHMDNTKEYRLYFSIKYVIKKLYRICINYFLQYGEENLKFIGDEEIPCLDVEKKETFFEALQQDKSHITTKLKQALYAIGNDFQDNLSWNVLNHPEIEGEKLFASSPTSVKKFGEIIQTFKSENLGITDELMVPAAFFIPQIRVGKVSDTIFWDFKKMSSGEQQMVHSIQSIIYHILNINSVHNAGDDERRRYDYVNIILDEIELYYHPQYQKKFVYEFLNSLKIVESNIDHIEAINILFSTHSPFILSDIPNWNVMKLSEGQPSISTDKTFAANIHDLLANDFFLQEGYFGEWAKYKLEGLTEKDFNKNQPNEDDLMIVDLVGEPILRVSLLEFMLQDRSDKEIDAVIARLQKLKYR